MPRYEIPHLDRERSTVAVFRAVTMLGGMRSTARQLDIAFPSVQNWCSGERLIPVQRAYQLSKLTKNKVTPEQLRPDLKNIKIKVD